MIITIRRRTKDHGFYYCLAVNLKNKTYTYYTTTNCKQYYYGVPIDVASLNELDSKKIIFNNKSFSELTEAEFHNRNKNK